MVRVHKISSTPPVQNPPATGRKILDVCFVHVSPSHPCSIRQLQLLPHPYPPPPKLCTPCPLLELHRSASIPHRRSHIGLSLSASPRRAPLPSRRRHPLRLPERSGRWCRALAPLPLPSLSARTLPPPSQLAPAHSPHSCSLRHLQLLPHPHPVRSLLPSVRHSFASSSPDPAPSLTGATTSASSLIAPPRPPPLPSPPPTRRRHPLRLPERSGRWCQAPAPLPPVKLLLSLVVRSPVPSTRPPPSAELLLSLAHDAIAFFISYDFPWVPIQELPWLKHAAQHQLIF
ncbi:formin-like protein 14 isoform X1 [Phragmites australis]|uniref:formin-like protein 14 isoform X1 n=1 Tax=Phragmites australis TaxID=29695 RepID=UPI002D777B82|nr:formin-like protein 14 isoform X1 [Phragmites australis]